MKKKIVILGAGESGAVAAVLAKKNGFDVIYTTYETIHKETKYIDDKKNGICTTYHQFSQKVKERYCYKDDEKNGKYNLYNEDGILLIDCEYIHGFISGVYREFYSNGNVKLYCTFIDGKKHGIEYIYDKYNHKLLKTNYYVYDKLM